MFKSLVKLPGASITITVDGRAVSCTAGENLAAVLLREGFQPFRTTPVSDAPRMPYCMMGVCFDCLAVVDGMPNRQTCLTVTADGMEVARQIGGPEPSAYLTARGADD